MVHPHELFTVTFYPNSPKWDVKHWDNCCEVRRNGDLTAFKDKEGKMVILTGGGIVAQQQVPTPDEIKSASGLVIPPPAVLAGLK